MQGNTRIDFANTLRGFAAVAVIISHYYGVFWLNRAAVEALTLSPALPLETYAIPKYISWLHTFSLLNWGAYGVAIFFLISGFVIPFSLQKMSFTGFCLNRILRIVPTYVVGFGITLLALWIGTQYFGKDWPYSFREIAAHSFPGIRDILWTRNIDGIIWTLEIEMKFYLVCALFIVWFRSQSLKVFLIPVALFLMTLYMNHKLPDWQANHVRTYQVAMTLVNVAQYIIFMFVGVMFHYLYRGRIEPTKAYAAIGGLFVLFLLHWWMGPYTANLGVSWNYGFALLTFMFAYAFQGLFKSNRVFDFLADISYPLYVIHGVGGYIALRILLDKGFKAWLALIIVTVGSITLSWLLHKAVEKPSQKLGKMVGGWLAVK